MNDTLSIVLTASAWAAGGGLAVWLVTMPLRRRSIVALTSSRVTYTEAGAHTEIEAETVLLNSARIEGWARVIINENQRLIQDLAKAGSCDCSYQLPGFCRFRVNIYKQNGNFAMV